MPLNQQLVDRVRKALTHLPAVEEKSMFGGITFMVNGKMCVGVSNDDLMCRIDPEQHDAAVKRKGARTMDMMKGKVYKGFIFVSEEGTNSKGDLDYWLGLALEFNKKAKASKKK
ncbi:MAG: TfoX/Sxy family protein [SAR202 cluster bacterium]|nr:TfoX/Sxy family protein [SAR202 cluster bacterium]